MIAHTQEELDRALRDREPVIELPDDDLVLHDSAITSPHSVIVAWGWNTTVSGSSVIHALCGSRVTADDQVTVYVHNIDTEVIGGHQIDMTDRHMSAERWCELLGVEVIDGIAYVFKVVNDRWKSDWGTSYAPGSTPEALDWEDDHCCGGGLHFSPTPAMARSYFPEATKFLRAGVALADLRPIVGSVPKCKAPRVVVPCTEVTL